MNNNPKPIEEYFPINRLNKIADVESTGFGRRHYRPIYTIHKWWARRLGSVFRTILLYSLADSNLKIRESKQAKLADAEWKGDFPRLWDFYSKDVDLGDKVILDPMMGGGTTVIEALRLGLNVVGGEINPVAWFVTKKEVDPIEPELLEDAFQQIEDKVGEEIRKSYKTACPECGRDATAMYYFWVKEVPCLNCGESVPLFNDYRLVTARAKEGHQVICPECWDLFISEDYREACNCPNCDNQFVPSKAGHVSGENYVCPSCGQKSKVIEAIDRRGKPSQEMYAIEFYCKHCDEEDNPNLDNGKGYKAPDKKDSEIFQNSKKEFSKMKDKLPLPEQDIPKGVKSKEPLNHGYQKFRDMFNSRQLLNLGKILKTIFEIENKNLREFMLLAFSNTLKYNNMFCKYDTSHHYITDIFRQHNYALSNCPVESNCFDLPRGRGSFRAFVNLVKEAKEYCVQPFERYFENGKKKKAEFSVPIKGKLTDDFEDLENGSNVMLLCGSSEYVPIPDKSVDAVVTDPPYYGNVMYSELSDFFYVWQRLILKDIYPHFESNLTPKATEVIKNSAQGKGEEEFLEGLTRIFEESARKLKDDGLMVFTFHHKEPEAWSAVLQSVLDSGFFVKAIYPIRSEMKTSTHIMDQANIEYDTIVVCRKRQEEPSKRSWSSLEDRISFKTESIIEGLEKKRQTLSDGDIFVIAFGKCLELYSKYYPNVVKNGEKVSATKAVESIREIVDEQILGGRFDELVDKLDTPSAVYLTFIAGRGGSISYNTLNKELRQRNIDVDDLIKSGLVRKEGDNVQVLDLDEKAAKIRRKKEKNLSAIDRAFYLIYLMKEDELAGKLRNWATGKAVRALEVLSGIENKEKYKELAKYIESKSSEEGLGKFM